VEEPDVFITLMKLIFLFPVTFVLSVWALLTIPFDKSGKYFRLSPWLWSKCIFWVFRIKLSIKGYENIDPRQPYVFVSNHASMFDIPAVIAALNGNVNIVFKKELTLVPVWGWALRYGHFIMIDRTSPRDAIESIERAAQSVRRGHSVILFPEGTRTADGKLQPFKRGAFSLAAKAGVPIVPMTINNTFGIMPKGSLNIKPTDISVVFEKPIVPGGLEGKAGELELMDQVHQAIENNYIDQSRDILWQSQ
jgi:1-acyl-sn-glycerol-3-phosphate acyltransferase